MIGRAYVCNKFPSMRMSRPKHPDIEFQNGLYIANGETEEEVKEIERIIEKSTSFKVYIHPRDLPEEMPAEIPVAEEPKRAARRGLRSSYAPEVG